MLMERDGMCTFAEAPEGEVSDQANEVLTMVVESLMAFWISFFEGRGSSIW